MQSETDRYFKLLESPNRLWPILVQVMLVYFLDVLVQAAFPIFGFNDGKLSLYGRLRCEIAEPLITVVLGYGMGALAYRKVRWFSKTATYVCLPMVGMFCFAFIYDLFCFRSASASVFGEYLLWPSMQTDGFVGVYLITYPALLSAGYSFAAFRLQKSHADIG